MRCLVIGIDDGNRSCVLRERDIEFSDLASGLAVDSLFRTDESPPPSRPDGRGDLVDLGVNPGLCGWSLWRFEPGSKVGMHHTDTVDFDLIVEGSIELILDNDTHFLEAGDCVVMTGVDHAWRAGTTGCVVSAVAIGTPPPSQTA